MLTPRGTSTGCIARRLRELPTGPATDAAAGRSAVVRVLVTVEDQPVLSELDADPCPEPRPVHPGTVHPDTASDGADDVLVVLVVGDGGALADDSGQHHVAGTGIADLQPQPVARPVQPSVDRTAALPRQLEARVGRDPEHDSDRPGATGPLLSRRDVVSEPLSFQVAERARARVARHLHDLAGAAVHGSTVECHHAPEEPDFSQPGVEV